MEYKVRKLTTKDFFRVASILGKLTKTALAELSFSTDENKMGLLFVNSALQHAETDLKAWLADLINLPTEEFDALPFETPILIIEELARKEDLKSFFTRVKSLAKLNRLSQ